MKSPFWPDLSDPFFNTTKIPPSERIANLLLALKLLGNPHTKLKNVIHITGTNGKGSVAKILHSMLLESGFNVNTYTSPHLVDYNERFFVNNAAASDSEINLVTERVKSVVDGKIRINFFDITFLIGLLIFSKNNSDFNIIEVGIGSHLDSTGVLQNKMLSIITSISLDHTEILGESTDAIASEKAKIISYNGINFSATQTPGATKKIRNEACLKNATPFFEGKDWKTKILRSNPASFRYISKNPYFYSIKKVRTNFLTRPQCQNAALAIAVYQYISHTHQSVNLTQKNMLSGLLKMEHRCRFEIYRIASHPKVTLLIDGSHNPGGIKILFRYLNKTNARYSKNIGIFAMLQSKDIDSIIPKFSNFDALFLFFPDSIRDFKFKQFYKPQEILEIINTQCPGLQVLIFTQWDQILNNINCNINVRLVCFGSLIFVGAIKEILDSKDTHNTDKVESSFNTKKST